MRKSVFYLPLLILLSFFTSCEEDLGNESIWQVYEEWGEEKYIESETLVGKPSIPTLIVDGTPLPGATYTPDDLPSTIQGFITSGILSIDFPETLTLSDEYSSEHTDGIKIARVHIQKNVWKHITLHKLDEQNSGVIIYYTDKDINCKTGISSEIQLKAGWNFWDEQNNIITQDINDFLNQGYRWCWESWD